MTRLAAWWSGWRVALRIARREVRRHGGRSVLIVLMVALPLAVVSGGLTLLASQVITAEEGLPWSLGTSQAALTGPMGGAVSQGAAGFEDYVMAGSRSGPTEERVPGYDPAAPLAQREAAISRLVGAPVHSETLESVRWPLQDRAPLGTAMHLDLSVDRGEKVRLESGRLPQRADEVLVTQQGVDRGLPSPGPVDLQVAEAVVPVTVVGTATAYTVTREIPDLVSPQPWGPALIATSWLVDAGPPILAEQVQTLNTYGFVVDSRAVLSDPAQAAILDSDHFTSARLEPGDVGYALVAGALLLIVIVLLVAPAFAVSARRQRRTLALGAGNGATAAVLRRWVLAQALVLGGVAAVVGATLGVGAVVLAIRLGLGAMPHRLGAVLDIPWWPIVTLAGFGVLSAVVAALLPARRLGRLDVVSVIRGQSVSPPLRRGLLLAGPGMFGLGVILLVMAQGARIGAPSPGSGCSSSGRCSASPPYWWVWRRSPAGCRCLGGWRPVMRRGNAAVRCPPSRPSWQGLRSLRHTRSSSPVTPRTRAPCMCRGSRWVRPRSSVMTPMRFAARRRSWSWCSCSSCLEAT